MANRENLADSEFWFDIDIDIDIIDIKDLILIYIDMKKS